jgi:membrane protein
MTEARAAPGRGAPHPARIPARGWRDIMLRVRRSASMRNLTALAAATAYYGFLAVPAAVSAAIALLGLMLGGREAAPGVAELEGYLPPQVRDLVSEQFRALIDQPRPALVTSLLASAGVALWSALAATQSLVTALNTAYGCRESRRLLHYYATLIAMTAIVIVFAATSLALIVLVPLAVDLLPTELPAQGTLRGVVIALRWPAAIVLFGVGLAFTYRFAPSRPTPRWRWVSWGAAAALAIWLAASIVLSVYASHFGSYERVYGSVAGVALLMIWLHASAFAIIIGAQINAEIERQVEGRPADAAPAAP